jgi:hypothetical protein
VTDVSSFANATGGQPRAHQLQIALKKRPTRSVPLRLITGATTAVSNWPIGIEDSIGGRFSTLSPVRSYQHA